MTEETLRHVEGIADCLEHLPGGGSMYIRQLCAEVRRLRAALKWIKQTSEKDNAHSGMRLGQVWQEARAALEVGE